MRYQKVQIVFVQFVGRKLRAEFRLLRFAEPDDFLAAFVGQDAVCIPFHGFLFLLKMAMLNGFESLPLLLG